MNLPASIPPLCTGETIQFFGGCIPFNGAVMAGLIAFSAAILTVIITSTVTLWISRGTRKATSLAALKRELFDARSQRLKEKHELRMQSEISLQKFREAAREDNRKRLEKASVELQKTYNGLVALIEEGPVYKDLRMIRETAKVLDVFGDFQSTVSHYAMPTRISASSLELVDHITKILLFLSPDQTVRGDSKRIALLQPLHEELDGMYRDFRAHCRDFDSDPDSYGVTR